MESRSTHPSAAQLECLMEFLEANPDLAKGFSKNAGARARSNLKWETLTKKLNSYGGTIKTAKKWIKYWSDKKNSVKKKAAARNAARRRTGGGLDDVPQLSEVEERILAVMGGERFAVGDSHLQYDIFGPSTSQDVSPSILLDRSQPSSIQILGLESLQDTDVDMGHLNQPQFPPVPEVPAIGSSSRTLTLPSPYSPVLPSGIAPLTEEPVAGPSNSAATQPRRSVRASTPIAGPSNSAATQPRRSVRASTPIAGPSNSAATQPRRSVRASTPIAGPSNSAATQPRPSVRASTPPTFTEARSPRAGANNTTPRSRRRRGLLASPPSQRRSQFSSLAEKFLRLEQQRLELDRRLVEVLEQGMERERLAAQAHITLGEGLKALAEAINARNNM